MAPSFNDGGQTTVFASPSIPASAHTPEAFLEAEILCSLLADNGMEPAILFDRSDRLVFFVDAEKAGPGAVDIACQVVSRFDADEDFRENVVQAVANVGHLLTPSPGVFSDLKTCTADVLVAEIGKAGWGLCMRFVGAVQREPLLSYEPIGDHQAPNSHLLLKLLSSRFNEERGSSNGFRASLIEHALRNDCHRRT